ncbi:hypothetical protein [Halosimplex halophilum]|uniref:hypothetical protein n=1 Tax=Halosimplex halophilum TaxID=2559572 RepID=UPI00107F19AD|nr:hypothetical protein [Halosimplex halophilum]
MSRPDPLYVASVAENVRSTVEQSSSPADFRRYLYELRDVLEESSLSGELYEELLDAVESHIERSYVSSGGDDGAAPVDDERRQRIVDDTYRIERLCQRRAGDESDRPSDTPDGQPAERSPADPVETTDATSTGGASGDSGDATDRDGVTVTDRTGSLDTGGEPDAVDRMVDDAFREFRRCRNWDGDTVVRHSYPEEGEDGWGCSFGGSSPGDTASLPARLADAGFDVAVDEVGRNYVRKAGNKYVVNWRGQPVVGDGPHRTELERIFERGP